MCGCLASSRTLMLSSRMFRNLHSPHESGKHEEGGWGQTYWSTDLRVPVMERSFLSSTVTLWSVSVLNTEKINWTVA